MLNTSNLVGFAATARPAEAKHFYESVLGLKLLDDGPYALVFAVNGNTLRVQKVDKVVIAGYTVLGWQVANITVLVHHLSEQGVKFERYEGLLQDEAGIWRTPTGASVAWFRDPDGNTLSLTELPAT